MADFVPAPGTRVTVDGVEWEWRCAFVNHALGDWVRTDTGEYVDDVRTPDLTRIAELEAEVAELEDELTELRPLACAVNDILNDHEKALARLARYEALGKEAAELGPWGAHQPATSICMQLAAIWRAQQEGR